MRKELDQVAEAAFVANQKEEAYNLLIELQHISQQTPKYLKNCGYEGETVDEALLAQLKRGLKAASKRAEEHLRKHG